MKKTLIIGLCMILVLVSMVSAFDPRGITVGFWDADGDMVDYFGLLNAQETSTTTVSSGVVSAARGYDGASSYANTTNSAMLNLTSNFAMAGWVKINESAADNQAWFGKAYNSSTNAYSYGFSMGNFRDIKFQWHNTSTATTVSCYPNAGNTPAVGVWQFWGFNVLANGSIYIYHNGTDQTNRSRGGCDILGADKIYNDMISANTGLWFGSDGSTTYLNGSLDEIALFNRSLTSTEWTDLYNIGNNGTGLASYLSYIGDYNASISVVLNHSKVRKQIDFSYGTQEKDNTNYFSNDTLRSTHPYMGSYERIWVQDEYNKASENQIRTIPIDNTTCSVYDYTNLTYMINKTLQMGMIPHITFAYAPDCMSTGAAIGGNEDYPPDNFTEFAAYTANITYHYYQLCTNGTLSCGDFTRWRWVIWNEAHAVPWRVFTAGNYTRTYNNSFVAIKAAVPTAQVCSASLHDPDGTGSFIDGFYGNITAAQYPDCFIYHAYDSWCKADPDCDTYDGTTIDAEMKAIDYRYYTEANSFAAKIAGYRANTSFINDEYNMDYYTSPAVSYIGSQIGASWYASALYWQLHSSLDGENYFEGTDNQSAADSRFGYQWANGTVKPIYTMKSNWTERFTNGTNLINVSINFTDELFEALATNYSILLNNKKNQSRTILLNASSWLNLTQDNGSIYLPTAGIYTIPLAAYQTMFLDSEDLPIPDTTAPIVKMINTSLSTTSQYPKIYWNFTDSESSEANCTFVQIRYGESTTYYWTYDGAINNTATTFPDLYVDYPEGNNTVYVNCTDASGNIGTSNNITIFVDSIPPYAATQFYEIINGTRSGWTQVFYQIPNQTDLNTTNITLTYRNGSYIYTLKTSVIGTTYTPLSNYTYNWTYNLISRTNYTLTIVFMDLLQQWGTNKSINITSWFNNPPEWRAINITPNPTASYNTLTCNVATYDNQSDPVTYDYNWTKNGIDLSVHTTTLGNGNFTTNDNITCSARPYDGYEYGTWNTSTAVNIWGMTLSFNNPQNTTWPNKTMNISWTNTMSGTAFNTTYYNLTLLNSDLTFNRTIRGNNSFNTSYFWNVLNENLSISQYFIRLQAFDNNSGVFTAYTYFNLTRNAELNLTARIWTNNASINNFSVIITDQTTGTSENYTSTADGNMSISVINPRNYTIWTRSIGYSDNITSININQTYENMTVSLYDYNTLYLTYYYEDNLSIATGPTIYHDIISDGFSNNYSTSNGTMNIYGLPPGDYVSRYYTEGYVERFFSFTIIDNASQFANLYLKQNLTSVLITLRYTNYVPIEGATIKAQKFMVADNSYIDVESGSTDAEGQIIMSLTLNDEYYRFIVTIGGETALTTEKAYIIDDEINLFVSTASEAGDNYFDYKTIDHNLYYDYSTNQFWCIYNDASNIVNDYCLRVLYDDGTTSYDCTTASAGNLFINITPTNGSVYVGTCYVSLEGDWLPLNSITVPFSDIASFAREGLFLQVIISIIFILVCLKWPEFIPVSFSLSLILGRVIQINILSPEVLGGICFTSIIISAWLGRQKTG